jgi:hypothetical protein
MPHLIAMADHFPPSLLGTGVLVMIALYHNDLDTFYKLAPTGNPVLNAMVAKKWLSMNKHFDYELTDKGKSVVEVFLSKPPKISKPKVESEEVKAVADWIDEWLNIWPSNVRSGGKLVRSDPKGCLKKMKWFVQEYGFSKDVIMHATRNGYLMKQYQDQWRYTMLASNFIYKEDQSKIRQSELGAWCNKAVGTQKSQFEQDQVRVKML